jgi:hypothetical protein
MLLRIFQNAMQTEFLHGVFCVVRIIGHHFLYSDIVSIGRSEKNADISKEKQPENRSLLWLQVP